MRDMAVPVEKGSMQTSSYHKTGHIEYNKSTNLFATVNGG
jgi:hypothetical protein